MQELLRQEPQERKDDILPPDARGGANKEVLPLAPEPILKEDGADKNDCERNAAKRLVNDLAGHPHLKAIIVRTRWPPTAPILIMKNKGFRYILGAKPGITRFVPLV